MINLLVVMAGGAIGAGLRYGVSMITFLSGGFPWSTLVVNLVGSFLIGFAAVSFGLSSESTSAKLFFMIGILGAFTTFSTYSLDCIRLVKNGSLYLASLNLIFNNVGALCFALFGAYLSDRFLG
jgi:fluoride exporter